MTSPNDRKLYYLPFWILLEYIGDTPPDPFIKVYLVEQHFREAPNYRRIDGEESADYNACTLAIHEQDSKLLAYEIPFEYLIEPENLEGWGTRLAKWFTDGSK